jgi:predicted flap endonuclease-1-like 5' DNA nuclease
VIGILGYLIGYVSNKKRTLALEEQLSSLKNELQLCQSQRSKIPVARVSQDDDLTIIEGIGPKIETMLKNAGIRTWLQLSLKTTDQITAILLEADQRMQMHDPSTWPEQARLANNAEWEKLKIWQDELNGGRKS